eukprot:3110669-Pyramimonas_sp.AAC.1
MARGEAYRLATRKRHPRPNMSNHMPPSNTTSSRASPKPYLLPTQIFRRVISFIALVAQWVSACRE